MWRPVVSRFGGLVCVASMACWTGGPSATPPMLAVLENTVPDVTGSYWCSMTDDIDADRELHPCVIKRVGNQLVLAKLAGEQRLRGNITLEATGGFTFVGEMYCPDDDCNQQLHGRFKPVGRGGFKGNFREEASMLIWLQPAPANAFAGNSYGGAQYGDPFAYDASRYGGRGYGNLRGRLDIHGRRRP